MPIADEHLYTVVSPAEERCARVLLVGPFASERHFSYTPWVRWARFLSERRIEALRFDYRGVGESTGHFEKMGFDDWAADTALLADWLQQREPRAPFVLHGFELGALLAARLFVKGVGDALLMWDAPATANQILRDILARHVAADNMFRYGSDRRLFGDYTRELESSGLDVEGYRWSPALWRESFAVRMPAVSSSAPGKPARVVKLQKKASWRFGETINPDMTDFFADNYEWMLGSLSLRDRVPE